MEKAIADVVANRMGYSKASQMWGVPKTTLERRVKNKNKLVSGISKKLGVGSTIIPKHLEDLLRDHILHMEECLFGLTCADVRKLAYELAERNNINHPFKKGMAGYYWYYRFLNSYPEISLRKPESTSAARSRSFNKGNVTAFFTILKQVMDEKKYTPNRIFNCDEKGFSTVPNAPPRILGRRGKKQVGSISSAERGVNVTALLCGNACGEWIPPMFIFPRKKENPELLRNGPQGCVSCNQPSGWMTYEAFLSWIKHFIKYIGCTKEKPALLILDNHITHVKSLEILYLARDAGLQMISLPPHCTHRMQPLDVTCMGPMEIFYSQAVQDWLRNHPNQTVSINYVAELVSIAYNKVVRSNSLCSGFKKCGIWPLCPTIFDDQFVTAHQQSAVVVDDPVEDPAGSSGATEKNDEPHSRPSSCPLVDTSMSSIDLNVTLPSEIMPLPKIEYKAKKKKSDKRKGKASLLTSSPYIKQLTVEEELKALKEQVKSLKKENKVLKKKSNSKTSSKSVTQEHDNVESQNGQTIKIKNYTKKRPKKKRSNVKRELFPEDQDDNPASTAGQDIEITELSQAITTDDLVGGAFVLVKFTVRDTHEYYAGYVTGEIEEEDFRVRFLRRKRMKEPSKTRIRFFYPDEDDLQWINKTDIVLVFKQKPSTTQDGESGRKSKRIATILEFNDARLANFSPIY